MNRITEWEWETETHTTLVRTIITNVPYTQAQVIRRHIFDNSSDNNVEVSPYALSLSVYDSNKWMRSMPSLVRIWRIRATFWTKSWILISKWIDNTYLWCFELCLYANIDYLDYFWNSIDFCGKSKRASGHALLFEHLKPLNVLFIWVLFLLFSKINESPARQRSMHTYFCLTFEFCWLPKMCDTFLDQCTVYVAEMQSQMQFVLNERQFVK